MMLLNFIWPITKLGKEKNILKSAKTFVEMPKFSCIDIDDLDDWYQAEKMFKLKK